jgi:regulator of replication initiation timing
MNRSILIVICDFLLVSLLAFSTVDINKVADQSGKRRLQMNLSTNSLPDVTKDLTAVMRLALDEERKSQSELRGELVRARAEASRQQTLASQREQQTLALEQKTQALEQQTQILGQKTQALDKKSQESEQKAIALQQELQARDQRVKEFEQELQTRQQQALKLEQDRAALAQQFAAAQTNIATLNQQVHDSAAQGVLSQGKLSAMEDQVRRQLEQSGALQQQLADLLRSNQAVVLEKERLASQLKLAETEKQFAAGQAARMAEEVKAEREEKARLAENVKALANRSGELAEEMRENRALAPNTIFNEFITNRVDTRFDAVRTGMLGGESAKSRATQTVLVNDGTNTYALCHVQETPLTLWQPGIDWDGFSGALSRNSVSLPIHSISFASIDPRIVLIPVSSDDARRLGCRVYPVSANPYKFQDAVLVGAREGYYGQCNFQIDLTTPEYVKLDRNVLKGLFGKFNPSRGDLVFSKSGELLGVMANSTYCLMLRHFDVEATFKFGPQGQGQRTGAILSALYSEVAQMPYKLQ